MSESVGKFINFILYICTIYSQTTYPSCIINIVRKISGFLNYAYFRAQQQRIQFIFNLMVCIGMNDHVQNVKNQSILKLLDKY